jgi:hypothetical protein
MKEFLKKYATVKKVLLFFVLTNVVYVYMLTVTITKVMHYSGGMKLPDMMPTGYNPDYMNSLLGRLGEEGRNAYLYRQIPADMVYPLLFAISWCLVLGWFLNKLGKLNGSLFYLCLIPVIAAVFDYFENIGMIVILNRYPENEDLLTQISNVFSILKSTLTTIYFITLLITFFLFLFNRLKTRTAN